MRPSARAALMSLAALGAAGLCAQPAAATEQLLTYTGVIDDFYNPPQDDLNIFTGPLLGGTLSISMLIQTDPLPGATAYTASDIYYAYSSVSGDGAASPILSFTDSVNGVAIDPCAAVGECGLPNTSGSIGNGDPFVPNNPSFPEFWQGVFGGRFYSVEITIFDDSDRVPYSADLTLPNGSYSSADGYSFLVGTFDEGADAQGDTIFSVADSSQGVLTVQTVPEPAAWALMIAGFGLAGTALRRRRRLALA